MRNRKLLPGRLVAAVMLLASCSSATTTTTTATTTTTTTLATTTTTTLPPGTPGDPEVLAETQASILRLLESEYPDIPAEDYPFPITITPDPVEAVRTMWEFEAWQAQNAPFSWFRELLFVSGSPADDRAGRNLEERAMGRYILVFDDPAGFQWEGGEVISIEDSTVPPEALSQVPAGSLVVRWVYSQVQGRWLNRDTENLIRTEPEVTNRSVDTVVSPTDFGWLMWWIGAP